MPSFLLSGSERYVDIILKVEEMLKSWFPHIKPVTQHTDKYTPGGEMEPLSKKQKVTSAHYSITSMCMCGCVCKVTTKIMSAKDTHLTRVCVCVCVCKVTTATDVTEVPKIPIIL